MLKLSAFVLVDLADQFLGGFELLFAAFGGGFDFVAGIAGRMAQRDQSLEGVIQHAAVDAGPWGVASFDLAVATRCESLGVRSTRFTRLEPMQLYSTEFRESLLTRLAPAAAGAYSVSAALFSWGEAVYDATGGAA
jgi:hypothetical protein